MIDPDLKDLCIPTGLLLGFQVTLFKWRLERESEVGDKGDIPWLVPSYYLSIIGMLAFVFGTVLLPLSGIVPTGFARGAFGLGALLFVGQVLGLAGHYQLFNRSKERQVCLVPDSGTNCCSSYYSGEHRIRRYFVAALSVSMARSNKSLDTSGGSVFRIMTGPAMLD